VLGFLLSLVLSGPVMAHHSFAAFDGTKRLRLTGTVKTFQFTNPHSWIQLVVTTNDGRSEQWSIELLSPNVLLRSGWHRSSVKPGDRVTVLINPMRDGSKGGNLVAVTLANGQTLLGGAT